MATVTGMTAEKILDLTNDSLVAATIDEVTGVLTLQTRDGQTVAAGNVDLASNAVDRAYPVGSIFMSTIATNPADQLGVGTWTRWGKGRVPVSLDEAQPEFDTTEEVGGEKTHLLTAAESGLRDHAHTMNHDHGAATTSPAGDHFHTSFIEASPTTTAGGVSQRVTDVGNMTGGSGDNYEAPTRNAGTHQHTFDVPNYNGNTGQSGASDATSAHNNLQPYITCYMWKRTA